MPGSYVPIASPISAPVPPDADLDMPEHLLPELGKQRVTAPFPIQGATLPNSLAGRDVLGRGRTGSGPSSETRRAPVRRPVLDAVALEPS